MAAELMGPGATDEAVAGSDIVYLTAGLPMISDLKEQRFSKLMANTIAAGVCRRAKHVIFDVHVPDVGRATNRGDVVGAEWTRRYRSREDDML